MFIQKNRVRISGKQTCPPNLLKCSTKPLGAILWRNPRQMPTNLPSEPPEALNQATWGDPLEESTPNTFRIYFQNIRGLYWLCNATQWTLHSIWKRKLSSQVLSLYGWAETNTNWLNRDDQKNEYIEQSTRTFSTAKSDFSTSSMPSESRYKPVGTATTLIGREMVW